MSDLVNDERNEYAVLLAEELELLELWLARDDLPADLAEDIDARRAYLRHQLTLQSVAVPEDAADEGTVPPAQ